MNNLEILSIDLSNFCSKQCSFCYNKSHSSGAVIWQPQEVIDFTKDCIENGVKAVSLGGGEPFEYDGIFDIIRALQPIVYLSVTTNGLPLLKESIWERLSDYQPDKIHITIHYPEHKEELERVKRQLSQLDAISITTGVNLLIDQRKLNDCREVYRQLRTILEPKQIILVPMRYGNTPTPKDLAFVTRGEPFQAPSCLLKCQAPQNFCSVSWNKSVNHCSYAGGKVPLPELSYNGLLEALRQVKFKSCL